MWGTGFVTNERRDAVEVFSNSKENASRVVEEWEAHEGKAMDGSYRTTIGGIDVIVRDIKLGEDDEGRTWIDVWTGNSKKPAFRIMNPPTLVRDARGNVQVKEVDENGTERTVKYRTDPVDAVAEVIAEVRGR